MIVFKNVSKTYSLKEGSILALRDINLHVQQGEIFGIIGKSGAGKSSLIRCVNGLENPDTGEVIVAGYHINELKNDELIKARHEIGMIFQHFNLLSTLNVYENIALPLKLAKNYNESSQRWLHELMSLTGITNKAKAYPSQLSGGEKQRVAIARALVTKPKILLSDEATSSLDPETTKEILRLLIKINKQFGITIMVITHEMDVIERICDRVAVINDGQIVEIAEVTEFIHNPQSDIGKKFLSKDHFEMTEEN